ncbi:MAG: thioredoxin domain-containing protein, partial [Actinobacteria bacterium]|nr:thioredoxin domain-containing protein [Actinomycetota bacterium]
LGHARYFQVASETIDYVLAYMRHPNGGFFSAEDADSLAPSGHSEEGAFYTWTPDELDAILGEWSADAAAYWGITDGGNFEGRSIPNRIHARPDIGRPDAIERCRRALLSARNERPRPGLDDKVLTEWNAMFLSTLAEAALLADNDRWKSAAVANGVFLMENLRGANGKWHRSWQADATPQARHGALAHDIAHVVDAFTRLYELTGNERWLLEARDAADHLIANHWDDTNNGLFTTSHDGEQLIARQKDIMDNATPSANSTAALALLRLAALLGDDSYSERARAILSLLARVQPQAPSAFCNAMHSFELAAAGTTEVVIPGVNRGFVREYCTTWRPYSVLAHGQPMDGPLWEGRTEGNAYVCRGNVCLAPASNTTELAERLATSDPT